jgi:hypothetical protein
MLMMMLPVAETIPREAYQGQGHMVDIPNLIRRWEWFSMEEILFTVTRLKQLRIGVEKGNAAAVEARAE